MRGIEQSVNEHVITFDGKNRDRVLGTKILVRTACKVNSFPHALEDLF